MNQSSRKASLNWIAAISLAAAVILCCGYFCSVRAGWDIAYTKPIPHDRVFQLSIGRGQIVCIHVITKGKVKGLKGGLQMSARFAAPSLWRSLLGFSRLRVTVKIATELVVATPIWCALLPCLVAPWMWLRRRRRVSPVGFAVITDQN